MLADREVARITRRLTKLRDERKKLLAAHLQDAVPLDLLKEEQHRLSREVADAEAQLAGLSIRYDKIAINLDRALTLAGNCEALFRELPPHLRRQLNQLIYTTLLVHDDDGIVGAELTDEFSALLAADLVEGIETEALQEEARRKDHTTDLHLDDPGSNTGVLVELRGLEPLAFALPARRSPS